jgi:hypothetical protein
LEKPGCEGKTDTGVARKEDRQNLELQGWGGREESRVRNSEETQRQSASLRQIHIYF